MKFYFQNLWRAICGKPTVHVAHMTSASSFFDAQAWEAESEVYTFTTIAELRD